MIIDKFAAGETRDLVSTPINLVAGQKYDIRLEYLETTGVASLKMYWEAPGMVKQIVQRGNLYAS